MIYVVEAAVGVMLVTLDLSQIAQVIADNPNVLITRHIPGEKRDIPDYIYKSGVWRDLDSKHSVEAGR